MRVSTNPNAGETEMAVRLQNVWKEFRNSPPVSALRNVSLEIRPGTLCVIEGPSGSGKTTLLGIIGGLERATRGHVWVSGREISTLGKRQLTAFRRTGFGFVFQDFKLIGALTSEENVAISLRLRGIGSHRARESSRRILESLGLSHRLRQRPAKLSGGERQRVAIARALVADPKLLLADEPTASLDSETGQAIVQTLKDLVLSRGTTAVITTHDPRLSRYADQILRLIDGTGSLERVESTN
jgi:putative ABC transport system ATP-binding protein